MAARRKFKFALPQNSARLNWANPILQQLVYCLHPGTGKTDLVRGQKALTTTGSPNEMMSGAYGRAITFGGADYFTVTRSTTPAYIATSAAAHTLFAIFRPSSIAVNSATVVSLGEVVDSNATTALGIDNLSSPSLAHFVDSPNSLAASGLAIAAGQLCVGAVSVTAANARTFMLNGRIATNATNLTSGACTSGMSIGTAFFASASLAASQFSGEIALVMVWNRALKPAEMISLYRNPGQVFVQPRGRMRARASGAAAYVLAAAAGAYALTGAALKPMVARILAAATGSYLVSGAAALLKRGYFLPAAVGSYAVTGAPASELRTYRLPATAGSYLISGQAAGMKRTYLLPANVGSYLTSGQAAGTRVARLLPAAAGAYAVSGKSVSVSRTYRLNAAAGAYASTGSDAGLTYSGSGVVTVPDWLIHARRIQKR